MLWTTTPFIENRAISKYCGVLVAEIAVAGGSLGTSIEVIEGVNIDLTVQTERFGEARSKAIRKLSEEAAALGADAIIGLRFEYVTFGKNGILNMVSAYGTAVNIHASAEEQERRRIAALREKADFLVIIDGKERGPFSIDQLSQLVTQGRIESHAEVRSEESGQSIKLTLLLGS